MDVRPLGERDIPAAAEVAGKALPFPSGFGDAADTGWRGRRIAHLAATDPPGAWVAEEDGVVRGVALALVRDGIWGLSLMAVDPGHQARAIGTRLLAAALGHGAGVRGGLIASSDDPKAMRLYARAGFDLRPCVTLAGIAERSAIPSGLRSVPSEDVEAAAAFGREVRGGAYSGADLAFVLAARPGHVLQAIPGRGFVLHGPDGSPSLLCARDDEAAADLLWSAFAAGTRGASVHVDFITAGQEWAVRAGLAAGLALSLEGPLFTRGRLGPLRPWLPSGTLL